VSDLLLWLARNESTEVRKDSFGLTSAVGHETRSEV